MKTALKLVTVLQLAAPPLLSQSGPEQGAAQEWTLRFQSGQQRYERADLAGAEECFKSALVLAGRFPSGDYRRGVTLNALGPTLLEQGKVTDAEQIASEALAFYGKCSTNVCMQGAATAMYNLANLYIHQNRRSEAEQLLREALVQHTRAGGDDMGAGMILESLGWLEVNRGRPGAAETCYRRALALLGDRDGLDKVRGRLYSSLSFALLLSRRTRAANEAARQGLAFLEAGGVTDSLEIIRALVAVAATSTSMGKYADAERALKRAQQMYAAVTAADSRELGAILLEFGGLRLLQNRLAEAVGFQRRGLEILSRYLSAGHPNIIRSKQNYVKMLRKLKRNQEARRVEQEIRAALRQTPEDPEVKYRISAADLQRTR